MKNASWQPWAGETGGVERSAAMHGNNGRTWLPGASRRGVQDVSTPGGCDGVRRTGEDMS